jgi:hypothetical protein
MTKAQQQVEAFVLEQLARPTVSQYCLTIFIELIQEGEICYDAKSNLLIRNRFAPPELRDA